MSLCVCALLSVCLQAACTPKELKELVTFPDIAVHVQPPQLEISDADQAEMKAVRLKRRIYELISNVSSTRSTCIMPNQLWQRMSEIL